MTKHFSSIVFAALVAALSFLLWMPIALAKQQCSASMPSNPHGYWSWRLIDGRKCWYEGKSMISKSSLEWPTQAIQQSDSDGELASALTKKPGSPLDSQARTLTDLETFDELWRARVERR